MPEAQYTISGFNIAGLDPIEVAKPVVGSSITLADADIGKMNVLSGSANTTVTLPAASGTLDGYAKAGRMIGLRGAAGMTAVVTINLTGAVYLRTILNEHLLVLVSDGTTWNIHTHRWPPMVGHFMAYRSTSLGLTSGTTQVAYDTVFSGTNADGWYNASTGIFSPLLPGWYEFNLSALLSATTAGQMYSVLQRNNTNYIVMGRAQVAVSQFFTPMGTIDLYANGVSDSFRPAAVCGGSAAGTLTGSSVESVFQATYKGPA